MSEKRTLNIEALYTYKGVLVIFPYTQLPYQLPTLLVKLWHDILFNLIKCQLSHIEDPSSTLTITATSQELLLALIPKLAPTDFKIKRLNVRNPSHCCWVYVHCTSLKCWFVRCKVFL